MEPLEREDSSTYINRPSERPEAASQPANRFEPPKKKKSRAAAVLAVLLVLALAGAGVLGWLLSGEQSEAASVRKEADMNKQEVARLKGELAEAKKAADDKESGTTVDTQDDESAALIKMALTYTNAKIANKGVPANATNLTGTVKKKTATFARVEVEAVSAGPGMEVVFFKYINKEWVLIGDGDGDPTKLQTSFGLPKDF